MSLFTLILQSLWFILPAYIANSVPVVLHGRIPIDFNKKFCDGRPILGKGKTWGGLFFGISAGVLIAYLQNYLWTIYNLQAYGLIEMTVFLGFALAFGALFGDILASFIKRRKGVKRGGKFRIVDRLFFIIMALLLSSFLVDLKREWIIILLIISPFIHKGTNILAYKIGIKKVPH